MRERGWMALQFRRAEKETTQTNKQKKKKQTKTKQTNKQNSKGKKKYRRQTVLLPRTRLEECATATLLCALLLEKNGLDGFIEDSLHVGGSLCGALDIFNRVELLCESITFLG